jgi:hypothetical protein
MVGWTACLGNSREAKRHERGEKTHQGRLEWVVNVMTSMPSGRRKVMDKVFLGACLVAELAPEAGEDDLVQPFKQSYATEQEHLHKVRAWVAAAQAKDGHQARS